MKWSELYADLLVSLGTEKQWQEGELKLYTNWGIRIYSMHFPLEKSVSCTQDGETQEWTLPEDFLRVNRVECPEDTFLEEIQFKPGTELYSGTNMWYVEGGKLHLTQVPDDAVTLHYYAKHTEMVDKDTVLSIPDRDVELLHLYVQARATARLMIHQARADRHKMRAIDAGNPEQNPLTPVHRALEREFQEALLSRLPSGNVEFYRKGRGE